MVIISTSSQEEKSKKAKNLKNNKQALISELTLLDQQYEPSLRPQNLSQYIGQNRLKELLRVCIGAAKKRKDISSVGHFLLYGSPGLGKTSCAIILARELGTEAKVFSAPALAQPKDIIGVLLSLSAGDVLFIDEIHRLNKVTEELLYSAMEDFVLDITVGKSQTARVTRLPVNRFILVGATTRLGTLSSPLRDRFTHIYKMEFYKEEELIQIIENTSKVLNFEITKEAACEIAKRSRGTPRIANRLSRLVRDFSQHENIKVTDKEDAQRALELFKVDPNGLEESDKQLLRIIIENYNGGPVGVEALAATLGEERQTIEDCYEPYLLQGGYLARTTRGRVVTEKAYGYLNIECKQKDSSQLKIEIFRQRTDPPVAGKHE